MSKRKVPKFRTDEEAEAFLEQDLSDLDFSQFKPMRFEFEPKDRSINLRLPSNLLTAVRVNAKELGIPYQRYIRHMLEQGIQQSGRAKAAVRKKTGAAKASARGRG